MTILDDVKQRLRISASNTTMDQEINDLIDAAKFDLAMSGINADKTVTVNAVEVMDPLIKQAIAVYCKANFGYDNPDADRLMAIYKMLKENLSLLPEYNAFAVTFNVTNASNPLDEASVAFNGETKLTGSLGTAIFYVRAGNNYGYTVSANGFTTVEANIDVTANATINIAMVVG